MGVGGSQGLRCQQQQQQRGEKECCKCGAGVRCRCAVSTQSALIWNNVIGQVSFPAEDLATDIER